MLSTTLKTEAQLRQAVIDRLIAASLNTSKPAREEVLARWRALNDHSTSGGPRAA